MNRRFFLQAGIASLMAGASAPLMAKGLGVLGNIANGSSRINDYKTLVCIDLGGGADSLSLFVPTQTSDFERHKQIRNNLSYDYQTLIPIQAQNQNIGDMAMPQFMQGMTTLFNDKKASIVSNVGMLREPTSLDMLKANKAALPPFFASHVDQEKLWHTGYADLQDKSGWAGRMLEALNANTSTLPGGLSLQGTRKLLRGKHSNSFAVGTDHIQNFKYVDWATGEDRPQREIFNQLVNASRPNLLNSSYTRVVNSSMDNNALLQRSLQTVSPRVVDYPTQSTNPFVTSELGRLTVQLKRAAELAEIAPVLGLQRQVIYVRMNAFDTHDNQKERFPGLMQALADSLVVFQADLEARGIDERVVTFTQSEFGRTMTINSNGTDHGWGGHQFVIGTPVKGGQIIGQLPEYEIGSNDVYQNTIIPKYSVEQYAGNIAKWFGISTSQITDVFPTYSRFDDIDMGLF